MQPTNMQRSPACPHDAKPRKLIGDARTRGQWEVEPAAQPYGAVDSGTQAMRACSSGSAVCVPSSQYRATPLGPTPRREAASSPDSAAAPSPGRRWRRSVKPCPIYPAMRGRSGGRRMGVPRRDTGCSVCQRVQPDSSAAGRVAASTARRLVVMAASVATGQIWCRVPPCRNCTRRHRLCNLG